MNSAWRAQCPVRLRSTKKPPARANHRGKVKWCRQTHGVMPAARAALSTSR